MWQVIGHEGAVELLQHWLERGQLPHALLLVGPRHVGKMTLALALAQALNCQGEDAPCGECPACRRIAESKHADVQVMAVLKGEGEGEEGAKKGIGIGQIQELQHTAALKPYEGRERVFIVDGAELLTEEAANRLLKTLEEPPSDVTLVLLTTGTHLLLPTVVSRCQRVELRLLPAAVVEGALLERGAEPERARVLSRLCRGAIGWALSALHDGRLVEERSAALDALLQLADAGISERFTYAEQLAARFSRDRDTVRGLLDLWLTWWHDLLLVKGSGMAFTVNVDRAAALERQARAYTLAQVSNFMRAVLAAGEQLDRNANARLVLEVLMLSIPQRGHGKEEREEMAVGR